jgi:hypothetical protein
VQTLKDEAAARRAVYEQRQPSLLSEEDAEATFNPGYQPGPVDRMEVERELLESEGLG